LNGLFATWLDKLLTKMSESELEFRDLFFDAFPKIPSHVRKLSIEQCILVNTATEEIVLNEGLESLIISFSSSIMRLIRKLPSTLKFLELRKTCGDILPELPEGLETLILTRERFKTYPSKFPESLKNIILYESSWIPVPEFPIGIYHLDIWGMHAKYLPRIPEPFTIDDFFVYYD
jgi:hypothetical protein